MWTGSEGQARNLCVSGCSWQATQILHLNTISTHSNVWPGNTVSLPTPSPSWTPDWAPEPQGWVLVLESDTSQVRQDLGFGCFIRSGLHTNQTAEPLAGTLPTRGRTADPTEEVHLLTYDTAAWHLHPAVREQLRCRRHPWEGRDSCQSH